MEFTHFLKHYLRYFHSSKGMGVAKAQVEKLIK